LLTKVANLEWKILSLKTPKCTKSHIVFKKNLGGHTPGPPSAGGTAPRPPVPQGRDSWGLCPQIPEREGRWDGEWIGEGKGEGRRGRDKGEGQEEGMGSSGGSRRGWGVATSPPA
jgi:hypothetical protein